MATKHDDCKGFEPPKSYLFFIKNKLKQYKMRRWIIKHWAYSYDSTTPLLGAGRHLRVVNTCIVLLCMAGMYNLLTEGFDILQFLSLLPFVILYFGRSTLFLGGAPKFEELDWEQQLQVLQKPYSPYLEGRESLLKELTKKRDLKYKGGKKWVEAWRIIFPFAIIALSLLIYWLFGEADLSFPDRRFF